MSKGVRRKSVLLEPYQRSQSWDAGMNPSNSHLYPFSLNSKHLSPTFFSDTTPRGHDPRTACRMAGVECRGGQITRSRVADGNDKANGILFTLDLSDRVILDPSAASDGGIGESDREEGWAPGLKKVMARRSSDSRP